MAAASSSSTRTVTPEGQADAPIAVTIEGDMSLPMEWTNRCIFAYIGSSCTVEMPPPTLGDWLLIQNATAYPSLWTLTLASAYLWTGSTKALAANDYVKYRAMDKDGTVLWREAP